MRTLLIALPLAVASISASAREEFPLPCERYVSSAMAEEYRDKVLAECAAEKARAPQESSATPAPKRLPPPPVPTAAEARKLAEVGKENARRNLKDPESARFRSLFLSAQDLESNGRPITTYALCGEVNAKNAMGGYVGFRRFMASTLALVPSAHFDAPDDESASKAFDQVIWQRTCGKGVREVK